MKNTQITRISIRETALRMDAVVDKIIDPENKDCNIPLGLMLIKDFNAYLSAYRLQIEVAKLTGNKISNPIVDMD